MTVREIAELYLKGQRLRKQAMQLSATMLATKFDRSHKTIQKIAKGMPCNVPDDEKQLILDCLAEHDRLRAEASALSMPRLCHNHGVSHDTVDNALVLMGAREVEA